MYVSLDFMSLDFRGSQADGAAEDVSAGEAPRPAAPVTARAPSTLRLKSNHAFLVLAPRRLARPA